MNKETLQKMIIGDDQGLLNIDIKGVYRIYGHINGKRGGAFYGFSENGEPIFGGGNLIHACMWWNNTWREINEICEKIIARFPNCEATPDKCN